MQYTVQPGDTLYKISRRYGISLDALIEANPQIKDPSLIMPGMVINIPGFDDGHYDGGQYYDGHCLVMPNKEKLAELCLPQPYPEVKVEELNSKYAEILQNILAGQESQMTLYHKYLYYHILLKDTQYNHAAELLKAASMIEMRHIYDTMEFIKMLGCEPRFENGCGKPWFGNYVNYELCNVCNLLMDVTQENNYLAKEYKELAMKISDRYISEWLKRAAEDKEHQAKVFKKYYQKYCKPMG